MRPLITLLALGLLLTAGACSGGDKDSFRNVDHDKNGKISYEELLFVYPEITPDIFRRLDTDNDGYLSDREYAAFLQSDLRSTLAEKAVRAASQAKPAGALRPTDTNQPAVPYKGEEVIEIAPPKAEPVQPAASGKVKPEKEKGRKDQKGKPDGASRSEAIQYTVVKGDYLSRIAQKFGVSVEDITRANGNMAPDTLRDGQVLTIPPRGQ